MHNVLGILGLAASLLGGCSAELAPNTAASHPNTVRASTQADDAALLDAVLRDVLVNGETAAHCSFYGTPGSGRVAILSDPGYAPTLPGRWTLVPALKDRSLDQENQRLLGIGIKRVPYPATARAELDLKPAEAAVVVDIFNAGGVSNGAVIGHCSISYLASRTDKGWSVRWVMISVI